MCFREVVVNAHVRHNNNCKQKNEPNIARGTKERCYSFGVHSFKQIDRRKWQESDKARSRWSAPQQPKERKLLNLQMGVLSRYIVALCLSASLATNLLRQTNTAKFHLACAHLKIKRGALSVSAWVPGAVPLHFQNIYKIQSMLGGKRAGEKRRAACNRCSGASQVYHQGWYTQLHTSSPRTIAPMCNDGAMRPSNTHGAAKFRRARVSLHGKSRRTRVSH